MVAPQYELFSLPRANGAPVWLGSFATYDAALRARDEDVLSELDARGGWYDLFEHLIVGPGLKGPSTVHRHSTAVGVDPREDRVPDDLDLADAREWLARIRLR